ncbi:MAG: helix-turn-helix domain-containing protein [Ferruginibacter sp.]
MHISRSIKKENGSHCKKQFEIHAIDFFLQAIINGNPQSICNDTYSMIWIQKGTGIIQIDMEKFNVEKDTLYYVKPGQEIDLDIDEDAMGFIISFAREFLELFEKKASDLFNTPLFNHFLTMPVIKIESKISWFMKSITDEMFEEFKNYFDLRIEILKGLLKIFVIYLSRQFENEYATNVNSRKVAIANLFFAQLEKNFTNKKMVKEYADMLCVSPNYLNEVIKEISGFTARHHIQQRIIIEAKRKVIFGGDTLKEIAYGLGFWDPAHFSKFFKNSSGINFTDFKKGISMPPSENKNLVLN